MLNATSKVVVAGLAALAFTADAVVLPTTPAAQQFGGFHPRTGGGFGGRPGPGFYGHPRGGWGGGGGWGDAAGVLGGLAAGAILGGALAPSYPYGGYRYVYVPQYYGHRPHHPGHKPRYVYAPRPHPQRPPPGSGQRIVPPVRVTSPVQPQGQPPSREDLLWESAQRSNLPADYKAYLDAFPNGFFAQMAKNRIASLTNQGVARSETEPAKALPEKGWKSTVPTRVQPQGQLTGSAPTPPANTLNQHVLAWAKGNLGNSKWNGRCEQFVEQATYGKSIGYLTAIIAWKDYVNKGVAKTGNVQNAPSGSLIYFIPDSGNNYDGNVAISDGEGNIIVATSNGVQLTTLNDWINNTGQLPLGFVNPPQQAPTQTASALNPAQTASDQPVQFYCMGGDPSRNQCNSQVVQTTTQPQNQTSSQTSPQGQEISPNQEGQPQSYCLGGDPCPSAEQTQAEIKAFQDLAMCANSAVALTAQGLQLVGQIPVPAFQAGQQEAQRLGEAIQQGTQGLGEAATYTGKGIGFAKDVNTGEWYAVPLAVVKLVPGASCLQLASETKPLSQLTADEIGVLKTEFGWIGQATTQVLCDDLPPGILRKYICH